MTQNQAQSYLTRFFEEKVINYQMWTLTDKNGTSHIIDTDVMIDAVKNAHPRYQVPIARQLIKIDFANGDVRHFLKYLAQGLIDNKFAKGN